MSSSEEEAEKEPLIAPADDGADAAAAADDDGEVVQPGRSCVVEPVVLLFCFSLMGVGAVLPQYFYYRVGLNYNATANATRAFVCNATAGANSSELELTQRIQDEASSWAMYQNIVGSLSALLVIPIYSSSSDFLGRKLTLLLPCIGGAVELICCLLVVLLHLPLPAMVAASAFAGLGGGFGTLLAGVFAYLADTTTKRMRAVRIAIAEGIFGLGAMVMEIGMGWWMKLSGYAAPLTFCCVCAVVNVAYLVFLVPEVRPAAKSKPRRESLARTCLKPFANIASVFSISRALTVSIIFLMLTVLLFSISLMSSMTVSSLYQMNFPFCMDSVVIGYVSTARIFAWQVGSVAGLAILRRWLGPHALMLLGLASGAAGQLLTGLARTRTELFVAPAVAVFSMLPMPLLRAHMSNALPGNKQGALFSCIGVIQIASNVVGAAGAVTVYKATLSTLPGFVFLLTAGLGAVAMVMTLGSYFSEKRIDRKEAADRLIVN